MAALFDVTLPVFLVIGFGAAAVHCGLFGDAAVEGVMKFTQGFAIPCLLFGAISTLDLGQSFDWALLASYYTGSTVCFVAGIFGARMLFARPWEDSVAIGFCCLFANSVLLGLAITERAFGADALAGNYAIVAVHAAFCYLLGITVMEFVRHGGGGGTATLRAVSRAMFRNALMIAVGLGFAVNIAGVALPAPITGAIDLMARSALPAALFGLGGVLVRYRPEGDLKEVAFICLVSLMLHPAIVWLMGAQAAALTQPQMRSAVVTAAMAPGVNGFIFANMYGVARRVAASAVLIGTALCILTASLWLAVVG